MLPTATQSDADRSGRSRATGGILVTIIEQLYDVDIVTVGSTALLGLDDL
jgi:hypothetical protein